MTRSEKLFQDRVLPKAERIGESVAHEQFILMLNPRFRHKDFEWEEFVPIAVGWAKVSCWQSFADSEWKQWEKEIKEAAGKSAEYAAKRILKTSGLLEWWPDPTKKSAVPLKIPGHHPKCEWSDCQGGCHDLFYEAEGDKP